MLGVFRCMKVCIIKCCVFALVESVRSRHFYAAKFALEASNVFVLCEILSHAG